MFIGEGVFGVGEILLKRGAGPMAEWGVS